ncbi:MAG TPA: nitrous oxide reductase accessory protein NosL [Acidobacteriota bacterium]|nr:nitrous oxide reductase accessory protein NosL [Acidobacteriota bacterium]
MKKHWISGWILGLIVWGTMACSTPPPPPSPPPAPPAQAPVSKQKLEATCAVCGMPVVEAFQNRFEGSLATEPPVHLCSGICAASYVQKNPTLEPHLKVIDFQTRALVPAAQAFYLTGSALTIMGAMPPTVAAFSDRTAAEQAAKKNGGKVLDWKGVLAELRKSPEFQSH